MVEIPSQDEAMKIVQKVMSDQSPLQVELSFMEAWILVANLQLANRHPNVSDAQKEIVEGIARRFQKAVVVAHPDANTLMEMGWNTRFDVDETGEFVNPNEEVVVHNLFTLYSDEGPNAMLSFGSRPQDWGNPRWKYKKVETRLVIDEVSYKQIAHFWFTENYSDADFIQQDWVKQMIGSPYLPGEDKELCGRDFLDEDDFWQSDWGVMPPHYEPEDEDYDY